MSSDKVDWITNIRRTPIIDVRSLGAVGNGVADSTSAITKGIVLLAAAGGGELYFPNGVYLISSTLVIQSNNITFRGETSTSSTIQVKSNSNVQHMIDLAGHNNFTLLDLGLDANFINQAYGTNTNTGILTAGSKNISILNCRFHAFGYSDPSNAAYASCINFDGALNVLVKDCLFVSNLSREISMNGTMGARIINNLLGSPNVTDSNTVNAWWDSYSGGMGITIVGANNVLCQGNIMYGCHTAYNLADIQTANGTYLGVYGQLGVQSNDVDFIGNIFDGLGNGLGTVNVTQGSNVVTGNNTIFTAYQVGTFFKVLGDGNLYKVTSRVSRTSITVTPAITRSSANNLPYQYMNSGDAITIVNVQRFSAVGNSVIRSGDNGFDILSSGAGMGTAVGNFIGNQVAYCANNGLDIQGSVFNVNIASNSFTDNGQQGTLANTAAITISSTTGTTVWNLTFSGNTFIDDQPTTTQLSAFIINTYNGGAINSNSESDSHIYSYGTPKQTLYDANTTVTQWGAAFNYPSTLGAKKFLPTVIANLAGINSGSPEDGTMVYCTDAKNVLDDAAVPGAAAVTGGSGALVRRQNGKWVAN